MQRFSTNEDIFGQTSPDLQYVCPMRHLYTLNMNYKQDILWSVMHDFCLSSDDKTIYYRHSDHLGSANWITNYHGDPIQYLHYLPYGELLLNQQVAGYDERYKFTDKERDAESGYDYFGARYYASPLYNWTSVDPLSDKFPQISPYAYCNWNPIKFVDPDGRIVVFASGTTNDQKNLFNRAVDYLNSNGCGGRYATLSDSKIIYTINMNAGESQFDGNTDRNNPVINWDPTLGVETKNGIVISPATTLDHEMEHACGFDKAKKQLDSKTPEGIRAWNAFCATTKKGTSASYGSKEEERVITGVEQTTARALGEIKPGQVTRTDHGGKTVRVENPISTKKVDE